MDLGVKGLGGSPSQHINSVLNHYPVPKVPQLREGMYQPYTGFDTCGPVYKPL